MTGIAIGDRLLAHAKTRLDKFKPYILAKEVKWSIQGCLKRLKEPTVVYLAPDRASRGNVLFSYKQAFEAFLLEPGQPIPNTHTNYWASMQMAKTFLDLGYCVDVINHHNNQFLPEKDYSIIVDVRWNLERLAPLLTRDCLKIMHIDAAHMLFHNAAESRRLLELQRRKGVTLRPRRPEMPNLGIEHADYATTTGNAFTISTFRYANKPIYRLPIAAAVSCPWPEEKDWEACRKHFLWFSSGGLVHKGLDLALDAFAKMPEYHLTVCAPVDQEEDFRQAYFEELYRTPNIETVGWVDVNSRKFTEIANRCIGLIYTSCSEGGGACAITCLHTGLIPIVSYEASVDVHDFGFTLRSCSMEDIKESIKMVVHRPPEELKERARKAWEFARAHHTREKFAARYREVIEEVLMDHRQKSRPACTDVKAAKGLGRTGIPLGDKVGVI
jgi:glycosyltransferase involved in cell wall biosynthesis